MFRFAVRRLRWLARVPGFPQCFDAILLTWTALRHRPRLAAMEALETAACTIPGVQLQVHRLGGTGFLSGHREIAHLHGNGLLDVLLSRGDRDEAVASGNAEPHHVFPASSWVSFWVRDVADLPKGLRLLELTNGKREACFTKIDVAAGDL
jgi:hypothetical protein